MMRQMVCDDWDVTTRKRCGELLINEGEARLIPDTLEEESISGRLFLAFSHPNN